MRPGTVLSRRLTRWAFQGIPTCMREIHEATFGMKPKLRKSPENFP